MYELALFAGAGGGILGGALLGWRCVGAVEVEKYPRKVLLARQRDGMLPKFPIWDDVRTFDGRPWRGLVDVVSGGFPCQDISCAGKGAGLTGARSGLWSEMRRIISEVRPRYAFMENSPMLTSRGLGRVLGDLAEVGYDAAWMCLSAADCGAPHKRERIWILAEDTEQCGFFPHAKLHGIGRGKQFAEGSTQADGEDFSDAPSGEHAGRLSGHGRAGAAMGERASSEFAGFCPHVSDADLSRCESGAACSEQVRPGLALSDGNGPCFRTPEYWDAEPELGRMAHGVARRVDRLRAIGNGQVPLVAARAFLTLQRELERMKRYG